MRATDEESPARKYVRNYLVREVSYATIDIGTYCAHNPPHPSAYSATLRGIHLPRWGRLKLELRNEAARRGRRALQQRMCGIHYTVRWGADRQSNNAISLFFPQTCRDRRPRLSVRCVTNKKPSSAGKVARACERRMRRALREFMFAFTWFGKLAVPPSTSVHTAPTTLLIRLPTPLRYVASTFPAGEG